MRRVELLKHLRQHGCEIVREGRRHSWWQNRRNGCRSAISRHREIADLLARKICRNAFSSPLLSQATSRRQHSITPSRSAPFHPGRGQLAPAPCGARGDLSKRGSSLAPRVSIARRLRLRRAVRHGGKQPPDAALSDAHSRGVPRLPLSHTRWKRWQCCRIRGFIRILIREGREGLFKRQQIPC